MWKWQQYVVMTVLAFVCSRPTSNSSVRWLWQSSVLLRPWNCPNVIISVIILCISIGMIRYICWLEGICMLYWRPVHRRLKGIGAPCLQSYCVPNSRTYQNKRSRVPITLKPKLIPLNSCIFFKAGMIPVILLLWLGNLSGQFAQNC